MRHRPRRPQGCRGRPDIADIVGADVVLARGGEVLTLPFHDGLSTTRIIDAARGGSTEQQA